jgi:HK97 family phage prohead protease|tara:strand:+ start:8619 stop:9878 length:1260 start_codon:yes stop_codon:yes gene_type:complete
MDEIKMVRKLVPVEIKEISGRVLEFTGSTEAVDRDGEVIEAAGWDLKAYRKNPVFMWAHDYRQPPIGKARKVTKIDGKLVFEIEFADREIYEFADTIYRLYKGGFLHATSVGFMPKEWKDGESDDDARRRYKTQELLELSAVPVPSNPEALINARDTGVISVKEFNGIAKQGTDFLKAFIPLFDYEKVQKPEETDDYIRIPVAAERGKHKDDKIRWITVSAKKGIRGIYCSDHKVIITYVFAKGDWTMAEAQQWVDGHKDVCDAVTVAIPDNEAFLALEADGFDFDKVEAKDMIPTAKEVSQQEMADEFDYVHGLVLQWDFNQSNTDALKELASAIIERLSGSDIPVDILEKVGAVLSTKNKQNLKQAQTLIQSVLDSAEPQTEAITEEGEDDDSKEIALIVSDAVREFMPHKLRRRPK